MATLTTGGCGDSNSDSTAGSIDFSRASIAATVSERFISFNIEMQQIVDGDFWGPVPGPIRVEDPPFDFKRPRLRRLTSELAPALLRISGSGASETYHDFSPEPAAAPPPGYSYVLTRAQWDGAVEFAIALDLEIVAAIAISDGTRDPDGAWTDRGARTLLEYSAARDHPVFGIEFGNELNLLNLAGLTNPAYDADDLALDLERLTTLRDELLPNALIVGPGAGNIGDRGELILGPVPLGILTPDALATSGQHFDVVSYHFYPAVSTRCGLEPTVDLATFLNIEELDRAAEVASHYANLRDRFAPTADLWNTETGNASCGGDPELGPAFVEAIRYVDHLGLQALRGVSVDFHNTLIGGDYGLIDASTLEPTPAYWAAVLWRRLMGERSLRLEGTDFPAHLRVYTHCAKQGEAGAVTLAVLNLDREIATPVILDRSGASVFELSASDLLSRSVQLNGVPLAAGPLGEPPALDPAVGTTEIVISPETIVFITVPNAGAAACGD